MPQAQSLGFITKQHIKKFCPLPCKPRTKKTDQSLTRPNLGWVKSVQHLKCLMLHRVGSSMDWVGSLHKPSPNFMISTLQFSLLKRNFVLEMKCTLIKINRGIYLLFHPLVFKLLLFRCGDYRVS